MGSFLHAVEDEMLCSSLMPDKVPYFNAPIYLQNKSVIGKVDEILGPINEVYFSVKMGEGMVASSFKKGDKVYIAGDKLLPLERFLPKPKVVGGMCFPSMLVTWRRYAYILSRSYKYVYLFWVTVFPTRPTSLLLQKEVREEAEAPRGVAVAEHQEDVGGHGVVVVAGVALEVTVVAGALEVAEALGSAVGVVAVVDTGEVVVVVFEAHDMYWLHFRREFTPSFNKYVNGAG